jgi:hypothetical protein
MHVQTQIFSDRLIKLGKAIANRRDPLGVGLKNQCFVGLAIEHAKCENDSLANHFGRPLSEWKKLIKINNKCAENVRTQTMLGHLDSMLTTSD